jgi:hypothetical protein
MTNDFLHFFKKIGCKIYKMVFFKIVKLIKTFNF